MKAALPVIVEGRAAGITRDVSASGVFFETDEKMAEGNAIEFTVEFDSPTGKLVLRCSGQIVRVE
ncbi:MAG: PilZ domain-containing protein, partial [Usitatibacter sp.]